MSKIKTIKNLKKVYWQENKNNTGYILQGCN